MRERNLILLIIGLILLCCILWVCVLALGAAGYFYIIRPARFNPLPEAGGAPGSACPAAMQQVMQAVEAQGNGTDPGQSGDSRRRADDSITLAAYPVFGDEIGDPHYERAPANLRGMQQDTTAQLSTWQLFTGLIPLEQRSMISEYLIFTDGPGEILAAVQQSYDEPDLWAIEVDPADLVDRDALRFTLVHEFAHLLSLNASQVDPDQELFDDPFNLQLYEQKVVACPTYFPGEGCSHVDSYINQFHERFWIDIEEEWRAIDQLSQKDDLAEYYDQLFAFYDAHEDQFVNDYAATNPSEDLAETFSYFIFTPRPNADSIAERKMLFFYEYPELVSLREQILQNFCEAAR